MADAPAAAPSLSLLDYLKMLFNGRAAVEQAIAEGKIVVAEYHTAGIKSAAFWASLLAGAAAVGLQAAGLLAPPWGTIISASAAFVYAVARGVIKMPDPTAGLKPFASTSECWLTILAAVTTLVGALKGVVSPQTAAVLGSVSAASVAISQSLAASGTTPASPAAPADPSQQ